MIEAPDVERDSLERRLLTRLSPERGLSAVAVDVALSRVGERTGVDFRHALSRAGFARGHLIDVVLRLPGGRGDAPEHDAAELLLRALLGEATFDDWIGELSVVPAPRGGPLAVVQPAADDGRFFPVSELSEAVRAAVRGLYAGLPAKPLWATGGEHRWTLFELDVERADDYPAQADVALCSTFMPEMLKCYLSGAPFASLRFSRHREIFAYLKFECIEGDPRAVLAARRVLEDALDAALVTERAGRVVGSGMGVVYSYVDFALSAVDRAIDVVRTVGRRVGLAERSWIHFFDSALEREWVGISPRSPLPPGAFAPG